jgi:hypothetical protein
MKSIRSLFRIFSTVTILLAVAAFAAAQVSQPQMAAPAAMPAQNSFCGNQPFCYEANDFAATITDFRTSTAGYYKVIDVIVRFQNKTNRPLILAYVAGSGAALDDRGNRYGVGGSNALRGIGQSYGGNNFDPKFNVPPGGFGDAQFELIWAPGQTVYGLTFELNLTIDEINTVEGNQHTLGGEFPLHYRGLSNGVVGGSQGQASSYSSQRQGTTTSASGLPPCGTTATSLTGAANSAGVQVPASTNTAVTNATSAFSSLGSLFGKKKAATTPTPTVQNAASTTPCAPAATSTGTPADNSMSATSSTAMQPTGTNTMTSTGTTAPANTVPGAATSKAATTTTGTAKAVTTTSTATTTAHPVAVVKAAPAPPANTAVKKPVPPPALPKKPAATN